MINFSPLITRRFNLKLKELSIGGAISLAQIPDTLKESATTEFIDQVIDSIDSQGSHNIKNARQMTVQERLLVVGHYIAHVSESEPDFPLGDGHYSDYLQSTDFAKAHEKLGVVGDDHWGISHLTGAQAETIERLVGELPNISARFHWLLGCIAAQMSIDGEDSPDPIDSVVAYTHWLKNRMQIIAAFPESQFVELLTLFIDGRSKLEHFFSVDVDDFGLIVLPSGEKEGGASLSPARFSVHACISEIAKRLAGKS